MRYFFHIHDGVSKPDEIGTECATEQEAWTHAVVASGEFLVDQGAQMPIGSEVMMDVMDEKGKRHRLFTFDARP